MTIHCFIGNTMLTLKTLQIQGFTFIKVTGYKKKKTVAFLYTKDKWTEKIFREATSLTIATIDVKYFWDNLNQES